MEKKHWTSESDLYMYEGIFVSQTKLTLAYKIFPPQSRWILCHTLKGEGLHEAKRIVQGARPWSTCECKMIFFKSSHIWTGLSVSVTQCHRASIKYQRGGASDCWALEACGGQHAQRLQVLSWALWVIWQVNQPEEVAVGRVIIHNLSIRRSGRLELGLGLQADSLGSWTLHLWDMALWAGRQCPQWIQLEDPPNGTSELLALRNSCRVL